MLACWDCLFFPVSSSASAPERDRHAGVAVQREGSVIPAAESRDEAIQPGALEHPAAICLHLSPRLHLRLAERATIDEGFWQDSTGMQPWWGGILLATWLAHEPSDLFQGRSIIELGCGSYALPSAVASLSGAAMTLATDGSQSNVCTASSMLACNAAVLQCSARRFTWEDSAAKGELGLWDMVLFADVLYRKGAAAQLATAISSLLRLGGGVIGAVGLHREGSSEIFTEMRLRGFAAREIPLCSPVLFAASEASSCVTAGTMFHWLGSASWSTNASRNECKLIRWSRFNEPGKIEHDMSEALYRQVLDAPRAANDDGDAHVSSAWAPME